MLKKVIIIVICVLLAAIIAVVATLGAIGYYSYASISETVTAPDLTSDGSMVIMSANIRRKEKITSFKVQDVGNHRWYKRALYYLKNIELVKPDIFGAQEVMPMQYEFLADHLVGYDSVVTYRDNRGSRSESCPIFYNAARFTLLDSGTFWLSETPDVMSIGWDCTEYRICTFVKLQDKDGTVVTVFNTHPDWSHDEARVKQLQVVADRVKATEGKCIVIGDMNSIKGTELGDKALAGLEAILKDSKDFNGGVYYGATFNGYGVDDPEEQPLPLDYIYLPVDTTVYEVGKIDKLYDGVYPSDHYPIWAKVKL